MAVAGPCAAHFGYSTPFFGFILFAGGLLFAILAVAVGFLLHRTTYGRRIFAVGNNLTTARFSGVRVDRLRLINFTLNGLAAGIASVLLTSRIGSTRPNIASGWELDVITIVVLGGIAITGGKGSVAGVILAVSRALGETAPVDALIREALKAAGR